MKRGIVGWIASALLIVPLILGLACTAPTQFEGAVFEDRNDNGIRDNAEPGIRDILVSNGITVTVTDETGVYHLPREGHFVFITTPSGHELSTPWYIDTQERDLDFGLTLSPQEVSNEFVFVQMTDIHLDTAVENLAFFEQAIEEVNEITPAFVVITGDLVYGADTATVSEAREWYDAYSSVSSDFDIPAYNAPGNHDVVGIYCEEPPSTDPGYNEQTYRDYFGPTYYSFDCGGYHCLVLDPNEFADGHQFYRVPDYQLEWLQQDIAHREGRPLLVFFHEPTPSWENRTEVLDLLGQHGTVAMFSGHWHQDVMIDSQGIQEQVTGALCGEWWFGPCPDGMPPGYRIVSVDADGISSFYRGVGEERQINITTPDAMVSGQAVLTAQVYTEHGALQEAFYQVDDGEPVPMSIEKGEIWDTAIALWDTTLVEDGYHTVTVRAKDDVGIFSVTKEFKVTEEESVPIGELVSHFDTYTGQYTSVRGQISFVAIGEPYAGEGTGAVVLSDETGGMLIIVAECITPSPPTLALGDTVTIRAVPIKYSWDFLTVSQEFALIQQYAYLLPEGLLVSDEAGSNELMLMRLLSGDGIQEISQ